MKARFKVCGVFAVLLVVFMGEALADVNSIFWSNMSKRNQEKTDTQINAFLDQQLQLLRIKQEKSPCPLNILETQVLDRFRTINSIWPYSVGVDAVWRTVPKESELPTSCTVNSREYLYQQRWFSPLLRKSKKNTIRADWWGNFDRLQELLEQKLKPLDKHKFEPYTPYGWYDASTRGVEYLLRDGRTVLGVTRAHRYWDKSRYEVQFQFSLYDVRRLPARGTWFTTVNNYGRGNTDPENFDDLDTFTAKFHPPRFKAIEEWERRYGLARKIDVRLFNPEQAAQIQIDPELEAFGRGLAQRRWERLEYVTRTMGKMVRQQRGRAQVAARAHAEWYGREQAKLRQQEARETGSQGAQTNSIAAGIMDGLNDFARYQQYWNARAAEAQSRYFQAQYGCKPGACGRSAKENVENGGNNSSDNTGNKGANSSIAVKNEVKRVTEQHEASGSSTKLLKKMELGSAQEQEACAQAKEQAKTHHWQDLAAQQSIKFGTCGECKPTQWSMGVNPNVSSIWRMTCKIQYSVDVKQSTTSPASSQGAVQR